MHNDATFSATADTGAGNDTCCCVVHQTVSRVNGGYATLFCPECPGMQSWLFFTRRLLPSLMLSRKLFSMWTTRQAVLLMQPSAICRNTISALFAGTTTSSSSSAGSWLSRSRDTHL